MRSAAVSADGRSGRSPVPGASGTPAASAAARAVCLAPKSSSWAAVGPTKTIPASSQRRANSASSERNPYPGWMAPAPVSFAARSTRSASR